jgi:hypothetical protein
LHDRKEFVPFGVGNAKLGHGVIEILAESGPLSRVAVPVGRKFSQGPSLAIEARNSVEFSKATIL